MTDMVNEIRAAAEGLASDMERAAVLADETARLLAQGHAKVSSIEDMAGSLYNSAIASLATFHDHMVDRIGRAGEAATEFKSQLEQVGSEVQSAVQTLDAVGTALEESLATMSEHAGMLVDEASRTAAATQDELSVLTQALADAVSAIAERTAEGGERLHELENAARGLHEDWMAFIDDIETRLQQTIEEAAQHVDEAVVAQLGDGLNAFVSELHQLIGPVIELPLGHLREEIVSDVREELTALADQAIEAVDEQFKTLIRDILGSRDRGDIEEQLMHELFEQLKPILDEIEAQSDVVKGIAGAVGIQI